MMRCVQPHQTSQKEKHKWHTIHNLFESFSAESSSSIFCLQRISVQQQHTHIKYFFFLCIGALTGFTHEGQFTCHDEYSSAVWCLLWLWRSFAKSEEMTLIMFSGILLGHWECLTESICYELEGRNLNVSSDIMGRVAGYLCSAVHGCRKYRQLYTCICYDYIIYNHN